MRFLNENAFATPTFFLRDSILRLIEVEGALRRINQAQAGVLNTLFNDRRLERVVEFEATAPNPYGLMEYLDDVRHGIWRELSAGSVSIDPYRRELQRSYLTFSNAKINPAPFTPPAGIPAQFAQQLGPARATSDIKAAFRAELRMLDADLARAIPKSSGITRAHLQDARDQIGKILKPSEK